MSSWSSLRIAASASNLARLPQNLMVRLKLKLATSIKAAAIVGFRRGSITNELKCSKKNVT